MNLYTNREEFIEKFREQQGLPRLTKLSSKNRKPRRDPNEEGRWDQLYKLEQLKREKLDNLRLQKERETIEKETNECTFSPRLNKLKSSANLNNSHNISKSNNSVCDVNSNFYRNLNIQGTLLERQEEWSSKKSIKIENIKQNQIVKETEECKFKPKLVINY